MTAGRLQGDARPGRHHRQHHVFMIRSHMGCAAVDATFKLPGRLYLAQREIPPIIRRCITPRTKARTLRIASPSKGWARTRWRSRCRRRASTSTRIGGRRTVRAVVSPLEGCLARGRGRPRQDDRDGPCHYPALGRAQAAYPADRAGLAPQAMEPGAFRQVLYCRRRSSKAALTTRPGGRGWRRPSSRTGGS